MTQSPTEPTQEQVAVKGWMEKLKFEWMPFGMWKSPEGHPVQRNLSPEEATFFYRTCQAEVTKAERRGEIHQLKMLKHWAELHGIFVSVADLDHFLKSLEQLPDQPLARENLKALSKGGGDE